MILKNLIKFRYIKNLKKLRFCENKNIIPEKLEIIEIPKIRYKRINYFLDKFENLEKKFSKIKISSFFFQMLILGSFYLGYKLRKKYENLKKKITEEKIITEFEQIITKAIIKFVFQNDGLYKDLQKVLAQFLQKDPTEIFITNLLEKLLRSKILFKKTDDLVRNKLLLKIVLQDDDIENKLKILIIKILKKNDIRKNLIGSARNFVHSSTGVDLAINGAFNSLSNENVIKTFSKEIQGFVYEKLDEKIYFRILTETIIDLLKNVDF